jgi:hypothetical protein
VKKVLIGLIAAAAVVGLVTFIWTSMAAISEKADEISESVITRYVLLLQSGQYGSAYDTCLSPKLQSKLPREEFVAAHAARSAAFGRLKGWEQTRYEHEADLFSDESLIAIHGVLSYATQDVFVVYKVDSAIDHHQILEILGSAGKSNSLAPGSW